MSVTHRDFLLLTSAAVLVFETGSYFQASLLLRQLLLHLLAPLFDLPHHLWIARPTGAALFGLPVSIRTEIGATLAIWLVLFYIERMLDHNRVGAHSSHLPRYFDIW